MKKINEKEFIWAEKYRPQIIDDVILPQRYKDKFKEWIKAGEIPNLGFFGSLAGIGKTTLVNVLLKELKTDSLWLNGSKETGVDTFRTKVERFASTRPINGKIKLVIIDEADYISPNAQALLRGDIEAYSANARFIFTGNYPERIIEPLLNRLQNFDLGKIYEQDKKEMVQQILKRLIFILENENIKYKKEDLLNIIKTYYPSVREMIMVLQQNIQDGELVYDSSYLTDNININIMKVLKNKEFNLLRNYVNELINPETFYSYLWKNMDKFIEPQSQPETIILLADYQDMSQRAKNKQIPLMAFFTKIMGTNIQIKEFDG